MSSGATTTSEAETVSNIRHPGQLKREDDAPGCVGKPRVSVFDVRGMPPFAVLKDDAVRNNHAAMTAYCEANGVSLAPHVKTSMAPGLIDQQLQQGCWGITVATVAQAAVLRQVRGYPRIVVANQIVDQREANWVANEIQTGAPLELIALVDSVPAVNRMDDLLSRTRTGVRVHVWLEIGVAGGRAGCRSPHEALEVGEAVQRSSHLVLRGVETYEGIVARDATTESLQRMRQHLEDTASTAEMLITAGSLPADFVLSAGGSAFFDVVVDTWRALYSASTPPTIVLRSGCYIAHDAGRYQRLSPLDGRADGSPTLQNALEVWGPVLSLPEAGHVVVGVGRRDISSDVDPPRALHARRANGEIANLPGCDVIALYDHHVVLATDAPPEIHERLSLGDLVAFGPSHPCTTFDKWKKLYLVDADYGVINDLQTLFH